MHLSDNKKGFTLIELLISMAMGTIILTAIITAFWQLQKSSSTIDERTDIITNATGAMYFLGSSISSMGYDPANDILQNDIIEEASGSFLKFKRKAFDLSTDETISIGLKSNDDQAGGSRNGFADNGATYLIIGDETDPDSDTVAGNIVAIRFAYAFDRNDDGSVELSPNDNIIWAIDTDDDQKLDTILDTIDDGEIDENDDEGGNKTLSPEVAIHRIRMVKIWLVTRSKHQLRSQTLKNEFVVGDQRYDTDTDPEPNSNYSYQIFSTTVRCKNMRY